jgi:hypothetical protein
MGNSIFQTILELQILQVDRIMTVLENYFNFPYLIYYKQYIPGFRANLSTDTFTWHLAHTAYTAHSLNVKSWEDCPYICFFVYVLGFH